MKNEAKLTRFRPDDAENLQNEMQPQFFALKTLGELIAAADGSGGICEALRASITGEVYGTGINILIQNCLDAQEKLLDDFQERAFNSPEWIIQEAELTLEMAEVKRRKSDEDIQKIKSTLEDLGTVLAEFGNDAYPKAASLIEELRTFDPDTGARSIYQWKSFLSNENAINNPESFINEAFGLADAARSGAYGDDATSLEKIRECIKLINLIFSKFGHNAYPKALTVRDKLRAAEAFIFQGRTKPGSDNRAMDNDNMIDQIPN